MNNREIKTKSVGRNVATSNPITLERNPETIIQFHPTLHGKGVSGSIVKYRKDRKGDWKILHAKDFKNHSLSPMEKIEVPISTQALNNLIEEVGAMEGIVKDGVKYGNHEYITVEKNKAIIINSENKKQLIEQIVGKGYSEEFLNTLTGAEPELADQFSAGRLQLHRRKILAELRVRLKNKYSETSGDDSWQNWILKNCWLLGANYLEPIEKQKINITGIMPDYLLPTVDGFLDILEIKLPDDEVIMQDPSHKGSWKWTSQTNAAVGQVVNYLAEIDRLRLEIEREIKKAYFKEISLLKPRAFILIGNSQSWGMPKMEGLRNLNHFLHGIEVLTYFDLIRRGEAFTNNPVAEFAVREDEADDIPF